MNVSFLFPSWKTQDLVRYLRKEDRFLHAHPDLEELQLTALFECPEL